MLLLVCGYVDNEIKFFLFFMFVYNFSTFNDLYTFY